MNRKLFWFIALTGCCNLIFCSNVTTKSTIVAVNTTKSSVSTHVTTKSTVSVESTTKSTTVFSNLTTAVNISKLLESNDLTVAASNNKNVKGKIVSGFNENFAFCKRYSAEFDKCIRDGLNNIHQFIPKGVPEFNIPSFDPIFAKEVVLKRGGPTFGYKLKLKNVRESGWRLSEVTKFKSNLRLNTVQLTQYFPDKYVEGEYEFESLILNPSANKGQFNLSLYELNQTTTLSKPRNSKSIKVNVDVQEIGDMKLHISNLLRGRTRMENLLDRMINSPAWRPGFIFVRPFVNELVSTAFTEIYNRVFNNFDFNEILPPA
ncbi:hypothetical protein PGB90_007823 [Kerria lacca]